MTDRPGRPNRFEKDCTKREQIIFAVILLAVFYLSLWASIKVLEENKHFRNSLGFPQNCSETVNVSKIL